VGWAAVTATAVEREPREGGWAEVAATGERVVWVEAGEEEEAAAAATAEGTAGRAWAPALENAPPDDV
jgi:hypothetical protein